MSLFRPSPPPPAPLAPQLDCDLLVIGAGAAGLAAAVTAAHLGLSVCVIEKEAQLGGTSAWSGGWLWVPRNPLARRAGIEEDPQEPLRYLRHELGAQFDAARVQAFLTQAPHMVDFFERQTALQFIDGNLMPDFHGRSPGAAAGGRSVCAAPFDARALGPELARLRPPLDLISLWGMGIAAGADLRHFMQAMRAWPSFWHASRRVLRHLWQRLLHGRGLHLVNGNALVARLLRSALDRGVAVHTGVRALRLLQNADRVCGARVAHAQGHSDIQARCGVVLACGGFPHDLARKRALFAHAPTGQEHWSAAPPSNTGDGLRLAEAVGAALQPGMAQAGAWAPVSLLRRRDGSLGAYPHLIERAKPGVIAVTAQGLRFVNEADSYHDFMRALFAASPAASAGEPVRAWLVCDHRFIRRYGLGAAKPSPMPLWGLRRAGYLQRARSLAELAARCGIDAQGLCQTVARYNAQARQGQDPDFGKGETAYNRVQGDAGHVSAAFPNPCMGAIEHGPFYAVQLVPGSLGTFAGLRSDASARVCNAQGQPLAGLYACGNDMASVMGGHYPSGGITLGPALTFGFIAAHHASGVPLPMDEVPQPAADTPAPQHPIQPPGA